MCMTIFRNNMLKDLMKSIKLLFEAIRCHTTNLKDIIANWTESFHKSMPVNVKYYLYHKFLGQWTNTYICQIKRLDMSIWYDDVNNKNLENNQPFKETDSWRYADLFSFNSGTFAKLDRINNLTTRKNVETINETVFFLNARMNRWRWELFTS